MPTTPILEMEEMVQAQANPYLLFNAAIRELEKAIGVGITKIVPDATANRDIIESDWGAYIRMTNAGPTVTVPENATLGVTAGGPLHFVCHIRAHGGPLTFVPESTNVVINAATLDLDLDGTATLVNVAEDEWDLIIGAAGS